MELSILNQREPENGAVRLVKLAEGTLELLPGAVFGVYDTDSGDKLAVLITGADGAAELALPEGGYYLIEQTAPDGFVLNESKIRLSNQVITSKRRRARASKKGSGKQLARPKTTVKPVAKLIKECL